MDPENEQNGDWNEQNAGSQPEPVAPDGRNDGLMAAFMDITGASQDQAEGMLSSTNYDLQLAVQNYFAMQDGSASTPQTEHVDIQSELRRRTLQHEQEASTSRVTRSVASAAALRRLGPPARPPQSWCDWLIGIALLPVRFGYYTLFGVFEFFMTLFGRRVITATSPRSDVLAFVDRYENTYGRVHPPFHRDAYSAMLREAKRDLRFAIIYLHSWTHQDTDEFCRETLADPALSDLCQRHNVIFWGCDVQSREGYSVSQAVRESTYPLLALVALRDNRMAIVARIQGAYPAIQVVDALELAINENNVYIQAARNERAHRSQEQELRREQEQAYEQMLKQDREKSQQQKEKQIEEQRIREREQMLRERELRKEQDLEQLRQQLRASIEDAGEPTEDSEQVVRVSLRFPDGTRCQRAFKHSDSLTMLYNFAFIQDACPKTFSLWTSMPKEQLNCKPAWVQRFEDDYNNTAEGTDVDHFIVDNIDNSDVHIPKFADSNLNRAVILVQDDGA